ncbi:MAG TPA: DUF2269 family protein [Dehalococcoidia bacterium]|nr:DUF2269 family protein [Dehalococcoidia bacterium]
MDDFDLYRLFKTLHVVAVVILGGGFVLEGIVGALVARVNTMQEARAYARLLYISENYLSLPAAIAIAVFGYLTADRFGYALDETWLALGQLLFYAIAVLAIVFLRTAANSLYRLTRDAQDGPLTPEVAAQLRSKAPAIVGPVTSVMFVAIIYLMVAKPAW